MANAKTTSKNAVKTETKTETKKAVVKENLTTESKAENAAPKTETVIENNGLEQTVKETPPKAETKAESKGVDFDAKTYIITNPEMAGQKILGSRGQLIEFDSAGSAKVDFIEAKRLQTIPGYTAKEGKK